MSADLDAWFFEIAVYRVSEDAWYDDLTRRVERSVEGHLRQWPDASPAELEHTRAMAQQSEHPWTWDYNDVVAWLRLKRSGPDMIKGYSWDVQLQRFRRRFTPYPFVGGITSKVLETLIFEDQSNAQVYQDLRSILVALTSRSGPIAGRHLDLRAFDAVGPNLDWRSLPSGI